MSIYKFLDCSKDLPINFIGEFFSEKLSGFSLKEKEKIIDLFKRDPKYFQKLINRRTNFYSDTLSTSLAVLLSEAMGKPADFKRYFFSGYNSFDFDVLYIFKKFNADISELATDFFETALNRNKFKVAQHVDEYLINSIDKLELKLERHHLISDISMITPEMRSKVVFHINGDSINNFLKELLRKFDIQKDILTNQLVTLFIIWTSSPLNERDSFWKNLDLKQIVICLK